MLSKQKIIYWNSSFLTIYLYAHEVLHAEWSGYISVEQVKQGCEQILLSKQTIGCNLVINDNRKVKGTWSQAINWLKDDYMPRVVKCHIRKIAFLYSPEQSARYSVDRLLEVNDQYEGQAFEKFEEAARWISNGSLEESHKIILVKSQGVLLRVATDDISHIYRSARKTLLQTNHGSILINCSLSEVMEVLPQPPFFRIHKSYIVNIEKIKSMKYLAGGYYKVYLTDMGKSFLTVSRTCAREVKGLLPAK